jgi:hypothetical protein
VSPNIGENMVDAQGQRSSAEIAREIMEGHKKGLDGRRERDLISEKLMLHIDGSGDFQWADIMYGIRVEIPRLISEYRKQENILRLVVDNAVAHHTTMPLQYFAESSQDRVAREKALIDSIFINYLAHEQDFNGLMAQAMYLAMPAGFCPLHAYWVEGTDNDWFEPLMPGKEEGQEEGQPAPPPMTGVKQGMIDCWVGNPFSTVFDRNARTNSIHWCSYERILPADRIRQHFGHIKGVAELQGTDRMPHSSEFQMIARNWYQAGVGVHGSPILEQRRDEGDEMMAIIVRESAPGEDPAWPDGRLQIIAVPGEIETRRGRSKSGSAVLLADQKLPGRDFSFELFYSHHRYGDIHGKPWVEDIDQLQVDLNIAISKRWELINKMAEAPIVAPGGAISEDMADLDGYNILEIEPSLATWRPRVMEWPGSILQALNQEIDERRTAIYTGGGYQASSRGEAPGSRTAYRAILALQQADNTVHGPVNMRFKTSAANFGRRCHKQFATYGDVPWVVRMSGDEFSYLAASYIDKTMVSDQPPRYKLVNAFGSSPELQAQEVLELMTTTGADGTPFLSTREARKQYPNQRIFDDAGDPKIIQLRRAKTVAAKFHEYASAIRQQLGIQDTQPMSPGVQQAGQQVFQLIEQQFPRLRDDDLEAHLATLTEITQDETTDPIARAAAGMRQGLYFEWQAEIAMQRAGRGGGGGAPPPGPGGPGGQGDDPNKPKQMSPQGVAAAGAGGGEEVDEGGRSPEIEAQAAGA